MRLKPGTLAMTILLAAMTSLGPLSTDIYVASLPYIGESLSAPTASVQLTISAYLIGFALGQVVYGPISDAIGRRPALLFGYALYIGASLICLFAGSIEMLIAGRIAQSFGGAGPIILARAIVRDLYEGRRAARQFGLMATIMGITPIVAPVAGGFLQAWFGWRASFVVMATMGVVLGAIALVLLPETNIGRRHGGLSIRSIIASYGIVARNPAYRCYLGIQACSFNGLFGFLSSSSYVLQRIYGLSSEEFGWAFALCSSSYVVGTVIGSRLVVARGLDGMIGLGVAWQFAAGVAQVVGLLVAPTHMMSIILPYMMFFIGVGFLLPQTQAAALTPFPERAGAASSLMGFIQMSSGAIVGTIVGAMLGASAWPLAIVTFLSGALGFAIFHLSGDIRRAGAPITRSFPQR